MKRKTMRKLGLIMALCAASGVVAAGGGVHAFGGPQLRLGPIAEETGVFAGGRGGVRFDSGFYLGGEGYGTVNRFDGDRRLGYGALFMGLWQPAGAITDWGMEVSLGAGAVGRPGSGSRDGVLLLRPALRLGWYAAPWLTATADVAWRAVLLSDTPGLGDADLSGWELSLGLAFGRRKGSVLE